MSIALAALLLPSALACCYIVFFPEPPLGRIFYWLSRGVFLLLPVLWTLGAERQRFPWPRLSRRGLAAGAASGLLIGLAILVLYRLVFAGLLPVAEVRLKAEQLGFGGGNFLFFAVGVCLANSSLEEYYWRWFGYRKLRARLPAGAAAAVSGAGFGLHHLLIMIVYFGGEAGCLFGVSVAAGGWLWCRFYEHYDSVWPGWVSHVLVDAALMAVGYDLLFGGLT